jgi:hypothetical protein
LRDKFIINITFILLHITGFSMLVFSVISLLCISSISHFIFITPFLLLLWIYSLFCILTSNAWFVYFEPLFILFSDITIFWHIILSNIALAEPYQFCWVLFSTFGFMYFLFPLWVLSSMSYLQVYAEINNKMLTAN